MTDLVEVQSLTAGERRGTSMVAHRAPRLSWTAVADPETRDWMQAAAQVELQRDHQVLVHDVEGPLSLDVEWPWPALAPRERVVVRVRIRGAGQPFGPWSEPRVIVCAALDPERFEAQLIGHPSPKSIARPVILRRTVDVDAGLRSATLYATSTGVHQVYVDGVAVDDEELKPGWHSYNLRMAYIATDVTALFVSGPRELTVSLAGGWYTELYGWEDSARRFYGEQPGFAARLVLDYDHGQQVVLTDSSWECTDSPITASSIYDGETYDAGRAAQLDDTSWHTPSTAEMPHEPHPSTSPPIRVTEVVRPVAVTPSSAGSVIVDFGQVLVGRTVLRVPKSDGAHVVVRHAEVLEDGELCTRPLRAAKAQAEYVDVGVGAERWHVRHTFFGFRYVEITGWPGKFDPDDVIAEVIQSDMRRTGTFATSNELINRLHENVVWGQRGNFLSIPTDCPQRDERLGWTGDAQVFAPTASFLHDSRDFLGAWMKDLFLEQDLLGGIVPFTVPNPVEWFAQPAAAWGDAVTAIPWALYWAYGDRAVLADAYPNMRAWVDYLAHLLDADGLWTDGFQFGDWLDPSAPPEAPAEGLTETSLVASASYIRSLDLTAATARVLGHQYAAAVLERRADRTRKSFSARFVSPDGRMTSDSATAYSVALEFNLVRDPEVRSRLGARLARLTEESDYRVTTGFVGTPLVLDALTASGHVEQARRLFTQTECPSWLYPVTMGATTIWERWDSLLPDGSVNPGEMTSFNHYAFGAVADWMHRVVAGISPKEPGYRVIRIKPTPLVGLDFAESALDSRYGRIAVRWERVGDGQGIEVCATIPPNTSAVVCLPAGADEFMVGSGTYRWRVDAVN